MKKFLVNYGFIISVVSFLAGIALVIVSFIILFSHTRGDGSHVVDFEVRKGVGSRTVGNELVKDRLIDDATNFRILLRLTGRGSDVKAGLYELNDGMSLMEITDVLTEGRVQMTTFTIPEGWNNRQIAGYLTSKGYVNSENEFLAITRNKEVLKAFSIPADSSEGYLFPETYTIPKGYPAVKIHEAMLRRFFHVAEELAEPEQRIPEILHETLILASIIEREAARKEELPIMAGVFNNRLNKKMRLESCATIQYLLPEPREKLYDRDLQIKSPYNTYKNTGLPPGPISNPGKAALDAALHPDDNEFLFFVLKPDNHHHFSKTYDEHLVAKRKYLGE